MAPQTMDQSDGEKVCGPDWIDKAISKSTGIVGLMEKKYPASRSSAQVKIEVMQRGRGNMP